MRDEVGEFLIEGPVAVAEALSIGLPVRELFAVADAQAELVAAAGNAGIATHAVSDRVLAALADSVTPQGVVAVAEMPEVTLQELAADTDLLLLLDEVRDPGNAGTLVRSALAAGAAGVIFGRGSVDPFGPKTVRSSAGAILNTKILRQAPLADVCEYLGEQGFLIVGSGADAPLDADRADLSGRVALLVGNEARGLAGAALDLVDVSVRIPMPGPAESLNVGVAGSILLFECVRQRRTGRG